MRALRRLFGFLILVGVAFAGLVVYRRRFAARRERVDLYYEDGSLVSLEQGSDGADADAAARVATSSAPRAPSGGPAWTTASCSRRSASTRYLEGDFLLRSGRRSSYYLDKYRFETRPDLLGALAERIAAKVAEVEPDARAARGARARRGRARRGHLAPLRAPVPDRPQGREGLRHRQPARRRLRARRPGVPDRGRRHLRRRRRGRPSRRSARPVSSAEMRSASSTARRAESTLSRVSRSECGRSSARPMSQALENPRKSRMVERIRCACYAPVRP